MSRAERRRAQKCEQKAKTATYNLTRAQLDALVREKISEAKLIADKAQMKDVLQGLEHLIKRYKVQGIIMHTKYE